MSGGIGLAAAAQRRDQKLREALGYLSESVPISSVGNGTALTDGTVYYMPHYMFAGETCSKLAVAITSAGSGVTLSKVGLTDSSFNRVAISADQGTAWQSATKKTISLTSTSTFPSDGVYFSAVVAKASTTLPSFARGASNGVVLNAVTGGIIWGQTLSAQTDIPASASPDNLTALAVWMAVVA